MKHSLDGRVAVVTGGTQGIGQATCAALIEAGATVASLDLVAGDASSSTMAIACDLRDPLAIAQAFESVRLDLGPIALLVNNAGVNAYFQATTMTLDEWEEFFAIDLRAAWLCVKAALPSMMELGAGAIVNVSSIHAFLTVPGMFPYAAAKSGLLGLTRSLALDLGRNGIRVNSVCPGWVRTAAVERQLAMAPDRDAGLRQVLEQQPFHRMGEPAEVASVIRFLLSEEASYVNGAAIPVDGGLGAHVHA